MMRAHVDSFEMGGAHLAISTFLIGLAFMILCDHGKRIGTLVVHTKPKTTKG